MPLLHFLLLDCAETNFRLARLHTSSERELRQNGHLAASTHSPLPSCAAPHRCSHQGLEQMQMDGDHQSY